MSLLSRKVRYALHGLGYIALAPPSRPVPFNKILAYLASYAEHLTLSSGYIAKIFQDVSRAGLTVSVSGPRGGYQLSRPAGEIHVLEVVQALDGPLRSECCLLAVGHCTRQETCGFRTVVDKAEAAFYQALEGETIASLAKRLDFPEFNPQRPT